MGEEGLPFIKQIAFADIKPSLILASPKHKEICDLYSNVSIILFSKQKNLQLNQPNQGIIPLNKIGEIILNKLKIDIEKNFGEGIFGIELSDKGFINFKCLKDNLKKELIDESLEPQKIQKKIPKPKFIKTKKTEQQVNLDPLLAPKELILTEANDKKDNHNIEVGPMILEGIEDKKENPNIEGSSKISVPEQIKKVQFISEQNEEISKEKMEIGMKPTSDLSIKQSENASSLNQKLEIEDINPYFMEHLPNQCKEPKHKYTVELYPAIFTTESFDLYKTYQEVVHQEKEKMPSSYKNFLCMSPLYDLNNIEEASDYTKIRENLDKQRKFLNQGFFPKYRGSYHMYHRIDSKLVAVGVIDITNTVVSSVYFFYDPSLKFINLGMIGALKEIEYIKMVQSKFDKELKYYYMGYYIQDCQKMVYKGTYEPSELLCPITYSWMPLIQSAPLIDKTPFSRLAPSEIIIDKDMDIPFDEIEKYLKELKMIQNGNFILFSEMKSRIRITLKNLLRDLFSKMGRILMNKVIFTLSY